MESKTCFYNLIMTTPLGERRGNLELHWAGDTFDGELTMFTRTLPIQDGRCSGNHIFFRGNMITPMEILPYRAEGQLHEKELTLQISTKLGGYPVTGILMETRRN